MQLLHSCNVLFAFLCGSLLFNSRGIWGLYLKRPFLNRYYLQSSVSSNQLSLTPSDSLPKGFDPKVIDEYYGKRPLKVWQRLVEIGSPVLSWWIAQKVDNLTSLWRSPAEQQELVDLRAAELKDAIVKGQSITFIKSGQALAVRQDLLKSPAYVRELQKLQDEVGTFDNDVAMDIISSDLGRPAEEVFIFDPPNPIASASIGQVYKARLRSNNAPVAVKVQRPDALRTVGVDMFILRRIAEYIKKTRKLRSDLVGIVNEFGTQLYEELNYIHEAQNCIKFKQLYGSIPNIYVPGVYLNYTAQRVLTMEFVEGEKGPWPSGGEEMLTVGLQCSVLQLLGTGFFHSDPHRGNLLRTLDGKLCYLDFGMMTTVSSAKRYAMIGTVLGLVNKDVSLTVNSLASLDFFTPQTNITNVISALNLAILNSTTETGKVSSLNFSRLSVNINRIQDQLTVQLPPYYFMIIRSLSILEGLALNVDKDFKLIRGAYPFILRQILTSPQPEMTALLEQVLLTKDGRINWSKLEQLLSTSNRASQAMQGNFTALKVPQNQSDILKNYQTSLNATQAQKTTPYTVEVATLVIDFLLSENGKFLREPLIEEIVDTVEALQLSSQSVLSILTNQVIPAPSSKPNREKITRVVRLLGVLAGEQEGEDSMGRGLRTNASGLRKLASNILLALQDNDSFSVYFEQWQDVTNKLLILLSQVLARLIERATRSSVQQIVSAQRVAEGLPWLSKVLDLLPGA